MRTYGILTYKISNAIRIILTKPMVLRQEKGLIK